MYDKPDSVDLRAGTYFLCRYFTMADNFKNKRVQFSFELDSFIVSAEFISNFSYSIGIFFSEYF